jgi:hypothetical protein
LVFPAATFPAACAALVTASEARIRIVVVKYVRAIAYLSLFKTTGLVELWFALVSASRIHDLIAPDRFCSHDYPMVVSAGSSAWQLVRFPATTGRLQESSGLPHNAFERGPELAESCSRPCGRTCEAVIRTLTGYSPRHTVHRPTTLQRVILVDPDLDLHGYDEVRAWVKNGADVVVLDAETGDDVTAFSSRVAKMGAWSIP